MFSFNMFQELPRTFCTDYTAYSISMLKGNEGEDVERGGKIIMPLPALDILTRLNISYPMLFKLTNRKKNRVTHCGVLEFMDETNVYLPYWMMRNLLLEEGENLRVESISLPVATFSRFQPQTEDFLDITNPKAVLENCLRFFACLTAGDVIAINYNNRIYELCVLETKPGHAVTIIECDMNVEFAPPVGYKEPEREPKPSQEMAVDEDEFTVEPMGFVPFAGAGNRLDGKKRKASTSEEKPTRNSGHQRGIPDYNYKIGTLKFIRTSINANNKEVPEEIDSFKPFTGAGFSLTTAKKK